MRAFVAKVSKVEIENFLSVKDLILFSFFKGWKCFKGRGDSDIFLVIDFQLNFLHCIYLCQLSTVVEFFSILSSVGELLILTFFKACNISCILEVTVIE